MTSEVSISARLWHIRFGHAPDMTFPHENEKPIGETKETAEEKDAYEAAQHGADRERDHAVGGSEGTTDGQ